MNAATLGFARQIAAGTSGLAALLGRSVVEVRTGDHGGGAGIIWGGSGLIVTNAHCAPRGAPLQVRRDGDWKPARVIAYHRRHDLAILSASALSGPLLEIRHPESLRVAELVFAHGHPLGVADALAMGIIHGITRDANTNEPRFVITDVRLAPGNSGGPLVDCEGRLVGVNSMVVGGLGVAVPASLVERFVERAAASRAA
jgi:serine protease Do